MGSAKGCPKPTAISSQSRYGHLDTARDLSQHQHLEKRGEPMRGNKGKHLGKDTRNPHKIKGFR